MPRPIFRPVPGHVPAPPAEPHPVGGRPRREPVVQEPQFRIPAGQRFARRHQTGKYRRPLALPVAAAIIACGLAATAVAPGLPAALAGLAAVGIGWSYFLGTTIAILQSADARMLGRVMSLFAVVLLGGASAGAPIASFLATSVGPRTPFLAGTAAAIAALAVAVGATRTGIQPSREEPAAVMVADKYSR